MSFSRAKTPIDNAGVVRRLEPRTRSLVRGDATLRRGKQGAGMSIESLKTEPVQRSALSAAAESRGVNLAFLAALAASFVVAYLPTYLRLAGGAWRTEQEGHGPIIMVAGGVAGLAAARQTPLHRIAAGAGRRLDHFDPLSVADGGHSVARPADGRGRDPNPGAFGMPLAHRRLEDGADFRFSSGLPGVFCAAARLAAGRVHRAAEGMGFRCRVEFSVRSWLPGGAERRHDHDRVLRTDGQGRLFRHEFDIRLVRRSAFSTFTSSCRTTRFGR